MRTMSSERAPARAGGRKNDPVAMRARILDAAFDLFQLRGYAATSVHEIAARAAVTGGALHHHFPTKKALGLAVIDERVRTALDDVWLKPVRSARNARTAILEVLENIAQELDAQGFVRGCPVNNLTLELAFADPDYRAELARLFELWRTTISASLGRGGDPRAALVVATYSGAMALAKVQQSSEPLRLCASELRRLWVRRRGQPTCQGS